jgi:putative restriction endonuclease
MAASLVEAAQLRESAFTLETRELSDEDARYGTSYLTRARLGQGAFKTLVLQAYSSHCAMTGEKTLPVLEAAHIRQYAEGGPHRTSNGLLLRSDLHTLFDSGYMTVTPDYRIEVSPRIRQEFNNGKEYYALHGRSLITLPDNPAERPSREFLNWHNEKVFSA